MKPTLFLLSMLLALCGALPVQAQPSTLAASPRADGIFIGYTNEASTQVLMLPSKLTDKPIKHGVEKTINTAFCGGYPFSLVYQGLQKAGLKDNGRQNHYNFSQQEGILFKAKPMMRMEPPEPRECFLLTRDFGRKTALLALKPEKPKNLNRANRALLEAGKGRKLKNAWQLAGLDKDTRIWVAHYVDVDNSALLSVVLKSKGKIQFWDIAGEPDPISTFRVDDGGEFSADAMQVGFAYRHPGGLGFGITWFGAEGVSLFVLETSPTQLKKIVSGGLYQAPK